MRLLHQNKEGEWGKYVAPPNSTQCYWVKASPSEMEIAKMVKEEVRQIES